MVSGPEGRCLVYCTDDDLAAPRKNRADINVIDLAARRMRVLIAGGVHTCPVWSAAGRTLHFPICRPAADGFDSEIFAAAAPARSR